MVKMGIILKLSMSSEYLVVKPSSVLVKSLGHYSGRHNYPGTQNKGLRYNVSLIGTQNESLTFRSVSLMNLVSVTMVFRRM